VLFRSLEDLIRLEGLDKTLATFIVTGLKSKKKLIYEILEYVQIKRKVEGPLTGKTFCFSGFRDNDLEVKIKTKGGRIASGVSKKLDYLVVKNKDGTTSKLDKARQYGVNIIDDYDLDGMINNSLF
jgi:NAD-dependent DNA ligase